MSYQSSKRYGLYLLAFFLLASLVLAKNTIDAAANSPKNTPPTSTLEQRIAQRQREQGVHLDRVNLERIRNQCVYTQGVLRGLSDSYSSTTANRDKVYGAIDAKLWMVIGSLKLVNQDTFKLEQQKLAYEAQVKKFDNQAAQFKQVVSDITAMSCQTDPNGFMSLVQTAKIYNAQVRQSFKDIRNQVVNNISPTITEHASNLKVNATE